MRKNKVLAIVLVIVGILGMLNTPLLQGQTSARQYQRPDLSFDEPEVISTSYDRFPAGKWCTRAWFTVKSVNGNPLRRGTMTVDPNYNLGWTVDWYGGVASEPRTKSFVVDMTKSFERTFCWQPGENKNRELVIIFRGQQNYVERFKWCIREGAHNESDRVYFDPSPPYKRKSCRGR